MSHEDDNPPQEAPTPESHGLERPTRSDGQAEDLAGPAESPPKPPEGDEQPSESGETTELSDLDHVQGAIESILLAADEPIERDALVDTFERYGAELVDKALSRLELTYSGPARGIHLEQVSGGWQLRTNPAFHDDVCKLVEAKPVKLSRAALETLAIVAYRQPVTRAEIEEIRGVNSSGVLRTLDECELVRVVGRLDDLGRPHVYGTTNRFLELFGLDELTDLPTLSEDEHEALESLYEDEMEKFDEAFD